MRAPKFSTGLHGGFKSASFELDTDTTEAYKWLFKRHLFRLLIRDGAHVLWEGRVEDPSQIFGGQGEACKVNIQSYGYYNNLKDIPYNTAYNAHADVVIKAMLTANCAQINADQSNIEATDITIPSTAAENYLDIYPAQILEKLLSFSDSTNQRWYFAVWEDRKPYLFPRT
ncbi:MAG: hypothetical protein PHU08_04460, partial [Dehalococcoidales bacterium]|nr:hypothetical protein [Dehalococcoidales bacterium]